MTDPAALLALAERIEQAPEGSRELGDEVLVAVDHPSVGRDEDTGVIYISTEWVSAPRPNPVCSVDDALSFVPEGWSICINMFPVETGGPLWTRVFLNKGGAVAKVDLDRHGPAQAITAASLRAMAADMEE